MNKIPEAQPQQMIPKQVSYKVRPSYHTNTLVIGGGVIGLSVAKYTTEVRLILRSP